MNKIAVFYVKTTETCNLNCAHCFTSGRNGRKIYFDPIKTAQWVNQFAFGQQAHFEFHGGEPFLASVDSLWEFYRATKKVWGDSVSYGATTNLTYKLDDAKLEFMDSVLNKRLATSWDPNIRFDNDKQRQLWENNVRQLVDRGYTIEVFVSLTRDVVAMEPIDIMNYMKDLGVHELDFERVTSDGYATKNLFVFPTNLEMQKWILKMHEQIKQYDARNWFYNVFMENIYAKFESNQPDMGTFCRNCEQKMFTINADGTVGGCPNAAPKDHYATIEDSAESVLSCGKRCNIIAEELMRDPRCYSCEMYKYCRGDCHQLDWEGDVCPAPKLLMKQLDKEINGNKFN